MKHLNLVTIQRDKAIFFNLPQLVVLKRSSAMTLLPSMWTNPWLRGVYKSLNAIRPEEDYTILEYWNSLSPRILPKF